MSSRRLRWPGAAAVAVACGLVLAACGSAPRAGDAVRISGSDTMLVLLRRLAVGFMTGHPGTAVEVTGGGTSVGIEALIGGDVDLCAASRPLAAAEVQRMFDRHGTLGVRVVVAQDALSVWVHPANPVRELSLAQLQKLFTGEVANWAEVGGDDVAVVVVVRPPSSGTFRFFRDHVLRGAAYSGAAVTAATTGAVVAEVAARPGAIGYGGVAYGSDDVVALRLDGADPSFAAVRDGSYPLARFLQLVSLAPAEGVARAFQDYCLSPAGQEIVAEVGYVPAWERDRM